MIEAKSLMRVFPQLDRPSFLDFDGTEPSLTLFQAAAFLALDGKSGLATLDEIEAIASSKLFPALAEDRLIATGIRMSTMQPERIPAARWHVVTVDHRNPGQLIEWTDSVFQQYGSGMLTTHEDRMSANAANPSWVKITVLRSDLTSLLKMPFKAVLGIYRTKL